MIAALEANPRVRGALMNAGYALGYAEIDGVPNARRAPLVAAYLAERFRPFYRSGAHRVLVEEGIRQRGRSRSFSVEPTVIFSFAANPPAISRTCRAGESGP